MLLWLLVAVLGAAQAESPEPPFVVVLGIAQDGGYPQAGTKDHPAWDDPSLRRRVSCLALVDPETGERWLFDATPDFKEQIRALDVIAPHAERPGLAGIFLTHAHVGHYAGLLHLGREVLGTTEVPVWAMPRMESFLRRNGPWSQLVDLRNIVLRPLQSGVTVRLNERLSVTPFEVPHRDEFSETVGYRIEGPQRSIFFLPDIDKWEEWDRENGARAVERMIGSVDIAYLDGSFFADGEVPGRLMSEIPHPFVTESLERFGSLPSLERAKIRFIHLNRTNPAIVEDSPEQAAIRAAGLELAVEGEKQPL